MSRTNTSINIYTLITVIIIFISTQSNAQSTAKGFELLKQKQYGKALAVFKKRMKNKKEIIPAKFGVASIYANKNYKKCNNRRAYMYLMNVNKRYVRLSKAKMKELNNKYGINHNSIITLKRHIVSSAFEEAKKKNSIDSYRDFCLDFPKTEQAEQAKAFIRKLEFEQTIKSGELGDYQEFIRKYPHSTQSDTIKSLISNLENKSFHTYTHEGELQMIENFAKQYPNCSLIDSLIKLRELAKTAFILAMNEKYKESRENEYLRYIRQAAPAELAYVALLRTLTPFLIAKDWDKAIKRLKSYKKYFPNNTRLDTVIAILQSPEEKIQINGISSNINSEGHEYSPIITPDGSTLYFCGHTRQGSIGGEDIFVSKLYTGGWSEPKCLKTINTSWGHEAPLAISADGNTMLLYANRDIYYSNKEDERWSSPQKFPTINLGSSWEADAMMTADGKAILFISDRKGNVGEYHPFGQLYHGSNSGNTDIYVSVFKGSGQWSEPINLGTVINTPYCERSPFLHPDMKTLYFSSDGHAGLGNLDVFKTVRLNDSSWTEWSEPINLGKEINSFDKDYDYKISTDGKTALFSSFKDEHYDILEMQLPEKAKPQQVATISGFITDNKGNPIHAQVKWENIETGEIIGSLQSNATDGSYFIALPLNKNYGYYIEHEDYYPQSGNINLCNIGDEQTEMKKNFTLSTYSSIIESKVAIPLENVFFETNSYELKPASFTELDRLVKFMQRHKNLVIEIGGHTDNVGSAAHNKELSSQRAKSVKNYLIEHGISSKSIEAKGYGESKPIASNNNSEGKSKNRRVEFRVIDKKAQK